MMSKKLLWVDIEDLPEGFFNNVKIIDFDKAWSKWIMIEKEGKKYVIEAYCLEDDYSGLMVSEVDEDD